MLRTPGSRLEEVGEIRHSKGVKVGIVGGDRTLARRTRIFAGQSAVILETVDAPAICFFMM